MGLEKKMTARPEAPTLEEQIANLRGKMTHGDRPLEAAIASLERLRAIEQAAGMPEPLACPVCKGTGKSSSVSFKDSNKTTEHWCYACKGTGLLPLNTEDVLAHCLHLKDRLARMEALLREPSEEMLSAAYCCRQPSEGGDIKTILTVACAALLSKLEKEKE